MKTLTHILLAGTFVFGMSGTALAQAAPSPHEGHEQTPAAQTPSSHQQHQAPGRQQPGGHQHGCQCSCCRMMMEMMQGHRSHPSGTAPAGQEDHQQHQRERPN